MAVTRRHSALPLGDRLARSRRLWTQHGTTGNVSQELRPSGRPSAGSVPSASRPGEVLSRPHRYFVRVGPSGRRLPHVDPVELTCRGWGGVEQRMQPMVHSGTNHVPFNTRCRNTSGQPTGLSQTAHGTNVPFNVTPIVTSQISASMP
ncbi:hypothetical protein Bbelb_025850 [Branchiostoma belcheri]|nr:hypothetical protein Bbelb_025850 [Branchiostoma belcheri]